MSDRSAFFPVGKGSQSNYKNAVASNGQKITIPKGYDRVYFLAASTKGDVSETFKVNGKKVKMEIQDYKEHIGDWDHLAAGYQ